MLKRPWTLSIHRRSVARENLVHQTARSSLSHSRSFAVNRSYNHRRTCGDSISTNWLLGRASPGATIASPARLPQFAISKASYSATCKRSDFLYARMPRLVLNRLLDGFAGRLTTSKYAKLAKCSQDTVLRDISLLVTQGILERNPEGGRSSAKRLWATSFLGLATNLPSKGSVRNPLRVVGKGLTLLFDEGIELQERLDIVLEDDLKGLRIPSLSLLLYCVIRRALFLTIFGQLSS